MSNSGPAPMEFVPAARAGATSDSPGPPIPLLAPTIRDAGVEQNRGSLSTRLAAPAATPLPTPVPIDPAATPLAAHAAPGVANLAYPVPGGRVSQPYRPGHEGLDIAAPPGTPILAAASGTVISAGWRNNGGGLVVEIGHAGGLTTVYNHLGSISVVAGEIVGRGAVIGGMGCSGICGGPHIQFDVRVNGMLIDPLSVL